ncbi:MAG: tRNA (cytidine(34)-2'-O)-methyltransferase [Oscillospiraceae bacterium]
MKLNIVLAEPQIPQNTGNIARTCAVTGAALHIIKPMGFTPTDKQLKRAGLDYWHFLDISYYDGFDDFFAKTSGNCFFFTTKAQNRYTDVSYPDNCYIVFGREDAGLPEELLFKNKNSCVRIPMMPTLRSLNLSNSVAIAAYEILRQWDFPELQNNGSLTKFDWSDAD